RSTPFPYTTLFRSDPHDRLDHDRRRIPNGILKGAARGGDERHFLRIDGVMLAVVHDRSHVLQTETGNDAFIEHLPNAFLDGRNELRRDGAAHDFVDELEALPAPERLDAQEHFAELARAARLFLVSMVTFRRARDRLAIGNARRVRL